MNIMSSHVTDAKLSHTRSDYSKNLNCAGELSNKEPSINDVTSIVVKGSTIFNLHFKVQSALVIRGLFICEFTYSHWEK